MWDALRGRKLAGLKFRRQHPIGPFVIDFCGVEHRLATEIDGRVHAEQSEQDMARDALLLAAGFRTLRFSNDAVLDRLPEILETIADTAGLNPAVRPPSSGSRSDWR